MSQNPHQALVELRRLVTGTKESTQKTFVSGEGTFDLPALSIDFSKETFFHLSPIFGRRPLQRVSSASRNHGRAYAQNVPAQDMIMLGIVSGIRQDLIPSSFRCSLTQNGSKLRRVLRRPPTDESPRQEMSLAMACNSEFRPLAPSKALVAAAPDIVTTDVTAFQARGINSDLRVPVNKFRLPGLTKNDG